MNNEILLPNRCHEWLQSLKKPVFTGFFQAVKSFPLRDLQFLPYDALRLPVVFEYCSRRRMERQNPMRYSYVYICCMLRLTPNPSRLATSRMMHQRHCSCVIFLIYVGCKLQANCTADGFVLREKISANKSVPAQDISSAVQRIASRTSVIETS